MCIRDRGNSRRNIRGARGDQVTTDWVPCSSGVRKELKLTCMLGATWATSSGLCQELFQAALDDPDTFGTSISCYRTGRVWSAGMVTLCAGGSLDAYWRVWRVKWKYHRRWQIWSKGNDFSAKISYSRIRKDFKLIYLKSLDGGSRYGGSKYRGEKVWGCEWLGAFLASQNDRSFILVG